MSRFLLTALATLLAFNAGQHSFAGQARRSSKPAKARAKIDVGTRKATWHSFGVHSGHPVRFQSRLGRLVPTTIHSTGIGRKLRASGVVILSGKPGAKLYESLARAFGQTGSEFIIYDHARLFLEASKQAETKEDRQVFKDALFSVGNRIESKPLVVFADDPTRADLNRVYLSHQKFEARKASNKQLKAAMRADGIAVLSRAETRRIKKSLRELEGLTSSAKPIKSVEFLARRLEATLKKGGISSSDQKNLSVVERAVKKARELGMKKLAVFDGDLRRESLNIWALKHYGNILGSRNATVIDGVQGKQLLELLADLELGDGVNAVVVDPQAIRGSVLSAYEARLSLGLVEAGSVTVLLNVLDRAVRDSKKGLVLLSTKATASDLARAAGQL